MSRISKKVREEAVLICSMSACTRQSLAESHTEHFDCDDIGVGFTAAVWMLANAARVYVKNVSYTTGLSHDYYDMCAEAEAMLRTGWTP